MTLDLLDDTPLTAGPADVHCFQIRGADQHAFESVLRDLDRAHTPRERLVILLIGESILPSTHARWKSLLNRRLAALWVDIGEESRAKMILESLRLVQSEPDPLVLCDLALLTERTEPQAALDMYAEAFSATGLLPQSTRGVPRDDAAFTYAMREKPEDQWLESSLRSRAEHLYKQQSPTLTVHNDTAWRSDGTSGYSRLGANTSIAHLAYPLGRGRIFLQADHVILNAGRFETDEDGTYSGRFGTCSFSGRAADGSYQALPGCSSGLSQTARGTSAAVGWSDGQLSVDIGITPQGFPVNNVVGGITYRVLWGPQSGVVLSLAAPAL